MMAAVVALAVVAAGLGVTAAALGIRMSGLRGELGNERLLCAEWTRRATDAEKLRDLAVSEAGELRSRRDVVEGRRRAELEQLHAIAARCVDPSEIRRWLQRLMQEDSKG